MKINRIIILILVLVTFNKCKNDIKDDLKFILPSDSLKSEIIKLTIHNDSIFKYDTLQVLSRFINYKIKIDSTNDAPPPPILKDEMISLSGTTELITIFQKLKLSTNKYDSLYFCLQLSDSIYKTIRLLNSKVLKDFSLIYYSSYAHEDKNGLKTVIAFYDPIFNYSKDLVYLEYEIAQGFFTCTSHNNDRVTKHLEIILKKFGRNWRIISKKNRPLENSY